MVVFVFTIDINIYFYVVSDDTIQSVELKISSYEVELMLGRLKKHEENTIVIGPELGECT